MMHPEGKARLALLRVRNSPTAVQIQLAPLCLRYTVAVSSERWRVGRDGRGVMPGVMTTTRMTSPGLVG